MQSSSSTWFWADVFAKATNGVVRDSSSITAKSLVYSLLRSTIDDLFERDTSGVLCWEMKAYADIFYDQYFPLWMRGTEHSFMDCRHAKVEKLLTAAIARLDVFEEELRKKHQIDDPTERPDL